MRKHFVWFLCSSPGLLTLRLPHLKGVRVSCVTQHIIQSMKHRHQYPSLVKSNPRCHSPTASPNLVSTVTLYCSTVLWNLGKCFVRVFVSARAARSQRPLAFVVRRPADALHILCRKFRLIQTWAMTRSSENADDLKLCCSTVLHSPLFAVWTSAWLHVSYVMFSGLRMCDASFCSYLNCKATNSQIPPLLLLQAGSWRQTAGKQPDMGVTDRQSWSHCCSSRPPPF